MKDRPADFSGLLVLSSPSLSSASYCMMFAAVLVVAVNSIVDADNLPNIGGAHIILLLS